MKVASARLKFWNGVGKDQAYAETHMLSVHRGFVFVLEVSRVCHFGRLCGVGVYETPGKCLQDCYFVDGHVVMYLMVSFKNFIFICFVFSATI